MRKPRHGEAEKVAQGHTVSSRWQSQNVGRASRVTGAWPFITTRGSLQNHEGLGSICRSSRKTPPRCPPSNPQTNHNKAKGSPWHFPLFFYFHPGGLWRSPQKESRREFSKGIPMAGVGVDEWPGFMAPLTGADLCLSILFWTFPSSAFPSPSPDSESLADGAGAHVHQDPSVTKRKLKAP